MCVCVCVYVRACVCVCVSQGDLEELSQAIHNSGYTHTWSHPPLNETSTDMQVDGCIPTELLPAPQVLASFHPDHQSEELQRGLRCAER